MGRFPGGVLGLFWNVLLEAQKHLCLLKGREAGKRECPWLAVSFWVYSNLKESTRDGKAVTYPLRTASALPGCTVLQLEKEKSQLKLTLARDVKKLQEKVNQVHQTTRRNRRKT